MRNEAGNVLGLMPHPEHAVDPLTGSTDGLEIFRASPCSRECLKAGMDETLAPASGSGG